MQNQDLKRSFNIKPEKATISKCNHAEKNDIPPQAL